MYEFRRSTQFRRDVKRCQKQHKDMTKFRAIHEALITGKPLRNENRDHKLTGNWKNHRECHIEPDWLLIYRVNEQRKEIEYVRMGSHADLFSK